MILADSGRAVGASWKIVPPSDASFAGVDVGAGAWFGTVTRVNDGFGQTHLVVSRDSLIPDTVFVDISNVPLVAIRIVDVAADTVVTGIRIYSDDYQQLRVEGLPANCDTNVAGEACWIAASGIFDITGVSVEALPSTAPVGSWTLRPKSPGVGTLTVSDVMTLKIPIEVLISPPSTITFTLLDKSPVAGEPFRAVVTIANQDGLIPGVWCYQKVTGRGLVAYTDDLGKGTTLPDPRVFTDEDSGRLGVYPVVIDSVAECFVNGVDTMEFVLYNAEPGNLHRLHVRVQGKSGVIEGMTERFTLDPGPVARVVIMSNGVAVPQHLSLDAPTGYLYAELWGYDAFGNFIGVVPGMWTKDGTLHDLPPNPRSTVYYTTTAVTQDEQGCIVVSSVQTPSAKDTVCLTVKSPPAFIVRAITRDTSGNGYLDRIELHFNKVVEIPDTVALESIVVTYGTRTAEYRFAVREIVSQSGKSSDSIFFLELTEIENGLPQTAWTPTVSFGGVGHILATRVTAQDGAGAVIWSVVKEVKEVDDRSEDIVTVTFSEPLERALGTSDVPGAIFVVWTRNPDGSFSVADSLLEGIDFFLVSSKNDVAKFQMVNGRNLTSNNYLSIEVKTPPVIVDGSAQNNAPATNNQRVMVQIKAAMTVKAAPNPMVPTSLRPNDEHLQYRDPSLVAQWAYQDNGTAFMVGISLPSDRNMTLEGELRIYDLAGNLVHYRPSNGEIDISAWKGDWNARAGTTQYIGVYWNGLNDQGMRCLPGVYRALIKLKQTYNDPRTGLRRTEQITQVITIGVKK